jgi:hypothetical protein
VGNFALNYNSSGTANSALGVQALQLNYSGNYNVAIGMAALNSNYGGWYNTAVGAGALTNNTDNGNMTAIGHAANSSSSAIYNSSVIGDAATVNASNKVRIGDGTMSVIEGQVAWSFPSDGRFKQNVTEDVKGLDFIERLRPVVYNFDTRKFTEFLTKNLPQSDRDQVLSSKDFGPSTAVRQSGFVAQEVVEAAQAVGYDFNGVHVPVNDEDNYSIAYSQFVVPLVKAVQEQQAMIEQLKNDNAEMKAKIELLESRLK